MEKEVKENIETRAAPSGKIKLAMKILLPVIVVGAGISAASYLKNTGPKSVRRPPEKLAPLVETRQLENVDYRVTVNAMGTVISSREVEIKSRVAGEVVHVHPEFKEGGLLKAGTRIAKIDPQDYRLALAQKEKAVADAEYALKLELGRQEVARREWELLNLENDAKQREIELALRKPHLEKVRAELTAAKAEVEKARLDLSRTEIAVPFNAMVLAKHVDLGSQATTQAALARITDTDVYWVRASIPLERLSWIRIPKKQGEPGSQAWISYADHFRVKGQVVRLMGDLSSEGRMARVLIEVKDPLMLENENRGNPPLLIGEYVRVQIEGKELRNVYKIPRNALRDNAFIWIVDDGSRLRIKKVDAVWKDADVVLIRDGLTQGQRLVVSDLGAPVDGMPVQLETDFSPPEKRNEPQHDRENS